MNIDKHIRETRRNNLEKLIETQFDSVHAFSKKVNRASCIFYEILSKKRVLGEKMCRSIENILNLEPNILDKSDSEFTAKNYELINVYASSLSKKSNDDIFKEEAIDQSPLNLEFISKQNWDSNYLCYFNATGDSMEPSIKNGARILINTKALAIIDNKIYAIRKDSEVIIKRLFKALNNKIIAKSDNPLYPELQIDLAEKDSNIKIIGQAVRVEYLL